MVGTTLGCFTSLMVCILGVCSSFHFFFCNVFQISAFCPEPVTLAFFVPCPPFPGLRRVLAVLALPSLFALGSAFPAFRSQPKHRSLGEPFPTTPPSLPPTPAFQRAVIAPTAPPASCRISFTTAILPLPMSLFHSYLSFLIRLQAV